MKYLQRSFTLPASGNVSQKKWDFAFLSPEEFMQKYGVTAEQYEEYKTSL